jgi:hypothetical protein
VGVCLPGSEDSCSTGAECTHVAGRASCDAVAGLCVECAANTDCHGGESCVLDACSPAACELSTCQPGLTCNGFSGICVHCQVDGDCNANEICLEGNCVRPPPPATLGCANVELCELGCFDFDCPTNCDSAATRTGALLYNALNECLWVACPSGDPDCWLAAETAGGACWAQAVACQQDP